MAGNTDKQIGICRCVALARERPRLPLEGKLSPSRATDEVCRKMLRFEGVSCEFVTFSTSSDRPSGGHLPLKGKAFEALPRQCLTSTTPNLQSRIASHLQSTAAVSARARPHHFETVYYRTIGSAQKRKIFLKLHKEVHEIRIPDHVKGE